MCKYRTDLSRWETSSRTKPTPHLPAPARSDVRAEELLREVAYVLHLTRQVRASMTEPGPDGRRGGASGEPGNARFAAQAGECC